MLMNTPGIFYPVIAEDLGVQTAEISAWMAICLLSAAVFQPWLGNAVSRFHMRTLMLAGACTMVVVFLVFSVATAPWMFWAVAVFTGFPFAACLSVGPATLVNRWFNEHVGMILGIFAACSAFGGVVFMLVGQVIIDSLGWRTAYLVYAAIIVVVCIPAIVVCIRDYPADCGLKPYGETPAGASSDDAVAGVDGQGEHDAPEIARQARMCMRTPAFILLLLAGFLMNMVCQVSGYLPKYVYWVDDQAAIGLMSVAFISGVLLSSLTQAGSAVGKLVLGAFSDFSVQKALVILCAAGAAGIACVWLLPSSPLMAVGGFVYGFFLASILVLVPMLVRSVFGAGELYPVLYARVAVAPAIGGAAANIVWPWLADNLGGFHIVFGLALVMIAVAFTAAQIALRLPTGKRGL
jgi:MFS family permease